MSRPHAQRDDDRTILDVERLWRRIHPQQITPDIEPGKWRPSSVAFLDGRGELSVDLASLTTVEQVLANYPEHSLAEVQAAIFRDKGYIVVRDPLPDNTAHALVCGRMTKAHAREIARAATWVVLRKEA